MADVREWVSEQQAAVEAALAHHGGVLFRNFPIASAEDFHEFVVSFAGWRDLSYTDSLSFAVRTHVYGRVCTTNDGKRGGMTFHHEQAQTPKWPSKLLFYCLSAATEGGGTGITSSALVMKELERAYPEFVDKCERLGVKYTALLAANADASKGVGRGWKSFWSASNQEEAEARMRQFGYTWEWVEGGGEGEEPLLKCTSPTLSCVREAPPSHRRVFFNQMVAQMTNAKEWADRVAEPASSSSSSSFDSQLLRQFLTFGDGSAVDCEPLEFARKVSETNAVELNWEAGDVGLLDNYQVMHARRPFEGPRQLLASLVE